MTDSALNVYSWTMYTLSINPILPSCFFMQYHCNLLKTIWYLKPLCNQWSRKQVTTELNVKVSFYLDQHFLKFNHSPSRIWHSIFCCRSWYDINPYLIYLLPTLFKETFYDSKIILYVFKFKYVIQVIQPSSWFIRFDFKIGNELLSEMPPSSVNNVSSSPSYVISSFDKWW